MSAAATIRASIEALPEGVRSQPTVGLALADLLDAVHAHDLAARNAERPIVYGTREQADTARRIDHAARDLGAAIERGSTT